MAKEKEFIEEPAFRARGGCAAGRAQA